MNYTLSYSDAVQGWVSFYSYYPDWMIGMNNFLYTFKGGNIYKHNVNSSRNTFYSSWWVQLGNPSGAFAPSTLQSVFNTSPLENKLFKTINIQGDATWDVQLETDLQYSGFIDAEYFEKKEAAYFAFIRNNSVGQLALRSVNGIGSSFEVINSLSTSVIKFSMAPLVAIGSIVSIGDLLYFVESPSTTPVLGGKITHVTVDYPNGINQLTVDTTYSGSVTIPTTNPFFMYIKNSVAESHGVLGHYCTFNLENSSTEKIELFVLESEVMKSFP